jgi:murein DD-endopeptidase MepM/ murein hydrolase activator NlpD
LNQSVRLLRRARIALSGSTTDNNQKYAFDFPPDINNNNVGEMGQDNLAAPSGIVVDEQAAETGNASRTGWSVDYFTATVTYPPSGYTGAGNFIVLRHIDGTYGVYWHFMPDTTTAGVGDYVKRGTVLGQDGYTGTASGPHLHFDVRGNWEVTYPDPRKEYPTIRCDSRTRTTSAAAGYRESASRSSPTTASCSFRHGSWPSSPSRGTPD